MARSHPQEEEAGAAVRRTLELAAEELHMDAVILGEATREDEIVHCAAGMPDEMGIHEGARTPRPMLVGRPATRQLGVRTYIRVTLSLRDARHFVLCLLARDRRPKLGDGELAFLRGIAESIRSQLSDGFAPYGSSLPGRA
jgi:hypothetical protein